MHELAQGVVGHAVAHPLDDARSVSVTATFSQGRTQAAQMANQAAAEVIRAQAEADAIAEAAAMLQEHAHTQPAVPATGQPAKQQTHTRPAEQASQQPAQATQQAAQVVLRCPAWQAQSARFGEPETCQA